MNKLETYIWKDQRLTDNRQEKQVSYKLVDMDEMSLNKAYDQCKQMLYNQDKANLGRMIIIDQINTQLDECGAELALRWFKTLKDSSGNDLYSEQNLLSDIRAWLSSIPVKENDEYRLQDFLQVPPEYKSVSITSLIKACRDALPFFNHSKISLTFIYQLGLYFTHKELKDMEQHTECKTITEKLNILKMQLGIQDDIKLKINPSGLTEQEFRDMIHLKKMKGLKKCKYSALSTSQLETLRNKVLYALEEKITYQANIWKTLMGQIEEVAEYKGYKLE